MSDLAENVIVIGKIWFELFRVNRFFLDEISTASR